MKKEKHAFCASKLDALAKSKLVQLSKNLVSYMICIIGHLFFSTAPIQILRRARYIKNWCNQRLWYQYINSLVGHLCSPRPSNTERGPPGVAIGNDLAEFHAVSDENYK